MTKATTEFLEEFYDTYPRIEERFEKFLDESLEPRGPDRLYDMVAGLQLAPGSSVADVGCGEGKHTLELAQRFGFQVAGIDPVPRHIEICNEKLIAAAEQEPAIGTLVRFDVGSAGALPPADSSVDLIWCRDVLVHVDPLDRAMAEFRRVLRSGGHVLIYNMFATDRLEPREATRIWATEGVVPPVLHYNQFVSERLEPEPPEAETKATDKSAVPPGFDPQQVEASFAAAGFQIVEQIELKSDWAEWREETMGRSSRKLIHAARLLRAPDRYTSGLASRSSRTCATGSPRA
ncbi:MAG: methyltransferase domain-containing protein [Dehalococcoidia bacterium]